jgi:hypothetical protein
MRLADEPLRGFGQRIIDRARLPVSVLLALPFLVVALEYFFFLIEHGVGVTGAIEQIKKDAALFIALGGVPPILLAFSRELQVHDLIDKMLGVRTTVDAQIRNLLQNLARDSGYDHPERIAESPVKAREWFYSFANEQPVLRAYAFEIWEAYFVGLYISLASVISLAIFIFLAQFFFSDAIVWSCVGLCAFIFIAQWAVRHWSTVPTIMKLPAQQVGEIKASPEILKEAQRRFG